MSIPRIALLAVAAVLGSACSDTTTTPAASDSSIRVINASGVPLDVLVDGNVAVSGLGVSNVSEKTGIASGSHVVAMRMANGIVASITLQAVANQTAMTVVVPSATAGLSVSVLADTGSIVPAGKSKLRVSNLAGGTQGIELWRTQPDFQTPVHIMTPFVYGATSPYLQSDPGAWEVFVTPPGGGAKLATTGAVNVPSGERRTVVLLDSLGVLKFRVIAE
jgi:hypothetical protein